MSTPEQHEPEEPHRRPQEPAEPDAASGSAEPEGTPPADAPLDPAHGFSDTATGAYADFVAQAPPAAMKPTGMGAGIGFGCLGTFIVGILTFVMMMTPTVLENPWLAFIPSGLLLALSVFIMIRDRPRLVGTGMLIVCLMVTIGVIGPCVALVTGV